MKQQRKYQIHLKSQNGPIHVLLVNKDAAANSPVVTPVPPPANDVDSNNHQATKGGDEPMETNSNETNDVNSKGVAVKTEVLESSRGIVAPFTALISSVVGKVCKRGLLWSTIEQWAMVKAVVVIMYLK